ncbi:MAG: hypothetical protein HF973_03930 [Chloroflexi bacterium]|nr:hypothetical protein [Chloroflexota bacterium]
MRRIWTKLLLVLLFVGVGTAVWQGSQPVIASEAQLPSAQSARDPRFGAIESFWAANEAAELGVGWERILFYWNEIQPNGPTDWNTLHVREEWLNEANAQGRQVVGLLKNTPNWATDGEFASGVPRGLYLPVDDPGNLWANYVRRIAQYYGPLGVHNWIIWNEPDIASGVYGYEFAGSVEDYYQLVKVAYQVMKVTDPQAKIHIGGMTHWHDPGYLRRFLQVVVNDPEAAENDYFFDVITYHIYFRPETIANIVGNGFAAQQQLGISPMKPVWINETNARPSLDPEWPVQVQAFNVDLEQQAWYIPQAFAIGFYAGAERIAVYKLIDININPGDESWGLIRPYDFSKRPAFYSYQNTIKYLAGFTYPIRREQSGNHYIFSFTRPQGTTRIMWARNPAAVTLNVPALSESGILVDPVTGTETPITPVNGFYEIRLGGARCNDGECLMGGPPLFLVEAGVADGAVPTAQPPQAAAPAVTATSTITATATVSATATLLPTATLTPTATAVPTDTPSPTATFTAVPTDTPMPTHTPMVEATAVEIALLEETAVPLESGATENEGGGDTAVLGVIPAEQASFWFLGAGLFLGSGIMAVYLWRRRQA